MRKFGSNSELFESIGYDETAQVMEIIFASGDVYQYINVAPELFEDFKNDNYHDKFYYRYIKDRYQFEKINF